MTFFEVKGVALQESSRTVAKANANFRYSCKVCSETGVHITCDKCAVKQAHEERVLTINRMESERKRSSLVWGDRKTCAKGYIRYFGDESPET